MGIPHGVQSPSDRIVMQNVSYCINLIDHSIGSSVHKKQKHTFVAQAISEIPELSHGIQDRCPRHSKHPSLLAMRAVFSVLSITLVGRFPELTPVRSQTTSRGFLPWMPVTLVASRLFNYIDSFSLPCALLCATPPPTARKPSSHCVLSPSEVAKTLG